MRLYRQRRRLIIIPRDSSKSIGVDEVVDVQRQGLQEMLGGPTKTYRLYNPAALLVAAHEEDVKLAPSNRRAERTLRRHVGAPTGAGFIEGNALLTWRIDESGERDKRLLQLYMNELTGVALAPIPPEYDYYQWHAEMWGDDEWEVPNLGDPVEHWSAKLSPE